MPFRSIAASPWPEADQAFRQDPGWLGSDGIGSVTIGATTLWLFGDTFVAGPDGRGRAGASMISNTVGVQNGSSLVDGRIEFHWKDGPAAVFEQSEEQSWLWPGGTLFTDGTLYVFCMKVVSTRTDLPMLEAWEAEGSLGFFEVVGTVLAVVHEPAEPPSSWDPKYQTLDLPDGYFLGSANFVEDGSVYSFGWRGQPDAREAVLARRSLSAPLPSGIEWFDGASWTGDPISAAPLFEGVATEFTVHEAGDVAALLEDPRVRFVQLQAGRVGTAMIELRAAPQLWGPWSEPVRVENPFAPSEPGTFSYTARAHPHISSEALAVSFCTIGRGAKQTIENEELYYPRFLRVSAT